jgi:hypothetical protein
MTPKQKASHLILTYMAIVVKQDLAKECALAAVEEIIKEYGTYYKVEVDGKYVSYWQEVKQELEKL